MFGRERETEEKKEATKKISHKCSLGAVVALTAEPTR
jgi:hypothetical protein